LRELDRSLKKRDNKQLLKYEREGERKKKEEDWRIDGTKRR